MKAYNLHFLPGQQVGIHFFTSRGVVEEIALYPDREPTYYINDLQGNRIGSFPPCELYNLDD